MWRGVSVDVDLARRIEYSCRWDVIQSFQFPEDMEQNGCSGWVVPIVSGELCADDSLDVFQENNGRSASCDAFDDCGE
jgi:hypothetical protein